MYGTRGCGKNLFDDQETEIRITPNSIFTNNLCFTNDKVIFNNDNKIKEVIFNDPATIVYWMDGTKTVVKCCKNEDFDMEKGLAMAVCKKYLGKNFHKEFKKWIPSEEYTLEQLGNLIADTIHKMAMEFRIPKEKLGGKNERKI